ncbi:MAG TPA: galactose oxidase early set domain-containing protein, partial [Actinomycetota bacterium]|nr:galactose oxidase early set domain-containing protein [Actinomycetota bacterium]
EGTSVLLPLLPPDYEPRVLICGGKTAWRIHLGQGPQVWKKLDRGELEGIERIHSCAVLLPTGRVFVSGGITRRDEPGPPGAALIPEVYDPGIDWDENEYDHGPFSSDSTGSWEALSGEPAEVARGYHSVALLLPDGRVWTAGSTDTAGLIAGSGVGSIAEGGSTLTLSSGEFGASAEGKEILVLGAGTPDDETNEPTDLRAVISDVVSATEATLDRAAGAGVSDAGVWWGWIDESRVEIYSPGYVGAANRPVVSTISSATYEETFTVTLENPQAIERVALIRCGTVTHAFDSDQRYVALEFVQSGDDETLTVTAPPSPQIAPPGNYMLWVVGGNERVAARAPFIRIADQEAVFGANKSNFSLPEVTAMAEAGDGEARFADALLLDFRGFLLHEIGDPLPSPEFELSFEAPLAGMPPGLTLEAKAPVTQTDDPDRAQHVVYPIDVVFSSDDAFESFTDEQIGVVQVRARVGERSFDLRLVLMRHSTPFMTDVRPDLQNPYWLSTDLRVFKMHPGDEKPSGDPSAPVAHGSDPFAFLDDLLGAYRQNPSAGSHPFDDLSENESLEMFPTDEEGPVFNYAVARVRYFAPDDHPAPGVRVFFRIFTTVGTAVEYDTATSYRREGLRESARPLLGKEGASIVSVPFFAEERVTPGGAMGSQPDDRNVQGLEGQAPQQYVGYFGCWLDNNQPDPQFPRFPLDDGPFTDVFFPVLSIQELMAGLHQCLVAEIHYWPVGLEADPILAHASPATSDKLAQRNLAFGDVANPGVVDATRTFHHSFELKAPAFAQPLDLSPRVNAGPEAVRTSPDASRGRLDPDELILWAPGLPDGSTVELYLPTVDAGRLLGLVERSPLGAARFEVRDLHTVAVELRPVVFVPVPGGANENLEGLISVTLPKGIVKEEVFEVVVQQWSGKSRRVVGSFELSIHVDSSDALLPRDMKRLSLLRHIAKSMPPKDRWYRVFDRWIDRAAERVRAFGGDPDDALPSPGGPGGTRPGSPDGGGRWVEGKIARLVYDCFGDFAGFVLDLCPGERRFASSEAAVESLARRACADRSRVRVYPHGDRSDRF